MPNPATSQRRSAVFEVIFEARIPAGRVIMKAMPSTAEGVVRRWNVEVSTLRRFNA